MRTAALAMLCGCQLAFPVRIDEDGDGEEDSEDPCPVFANESSSDQDDDGIPDDCDLRNTEGGEQRVYFGFGDGRAPRGSDPDLISNGAIAIAAPAAVDVLDGKDTIEARVELAFALVVTGERPAVKVILATSAADDDGYACTLTVDADSEPNLLTIDNVPDATTTMTRFGGTLANARIVFQRLLGPAQQDGDLFCEVTRDGQPSGTSLPTQAIPVGSAPRAGLALIRTTDVELRVDSIYVVFTRP